MHNYFDSFDLVASGDIIFVKLSGSKIYKLTTFVTVTVHDIKIRVCDDAGHAFKSGSKGLKKSR